MTDFSCEGTCSFTRVIRSVADEPITYETSFTGVSGTVTPSTFTLNKNDFQVLQIEVDTTGLTPEEYAFGQLVISDVPEAPVDSFTQSVGVEIPDNGYPSDMACGQVNVSGVTHPVVGDISVDLDIGHPWIGDLVISVENPNGDLLGLLDEPSTNATSDFETGATVRFIDTATTPGNDSDGCAAGNTCELQPDPGANFTTPPSTLADMVATDPNGTWEVCVGDAESILTGPFNGFSINFPSGDPVPAPTLSKMPITVYALPLLPIISVAPESLDFSMASDATDSQDIDISNDAAATGALDWSEQTTGTAYVKLFEQANLNDNDGIVSDYFDEGSNYGAYSADMFTLINDSSVDQFYFDGFSSNGGDTTANIDAFTVEVYADAGSVPAGDPESAGSALHVLNLPLSSPNLIVTPDGGITVNVKAELGSGWSLSSGNYWVTGYANFTGVDRWNWFAGVPNTGTNAHIIDPSDAFGAGFTTWTDLTTGVGPEFAGLSYNLSSEYDCGAPWLSVSPSSGAGIAVGGSETVSVTVDTTGMAVGTYTAALCIASNDFFNPVVAVPVSVTVN